MTTPDTYAPSRFCSSMISAGKPRRPRERARRSGGAFRQEARSGAEALELCSSRTRWPWRSWTCKCRRWSGFELAERMRGGLPRTSNIPIIFVTAGAPRPEQDVSRATTPEPVDFLYKPFEPYIVRHKANTFLELYRQRRALEQALRLNEELAHGECGRSRSSEPAPRHSDDRRADVRHVMAELAVIDLTAARIRSSGKRMVRMIDELPSDLSRARLGAAFLIEPRPTDLRARSTVTGKIIAEHRAGSAFARPPDFGAMWRPGRRMGRQPHRAGAIQAWSVARSSAMATPKAPSRVEASGRGRGSRRIRPQRWFPGRPDERWSTRFGCSSGPRRTPRRETRVLSLRPLHRFTRLRWPTAQDPSRQNPEKLPVRRFESDYRDAASIRTPSA